MSYFKKKNKFSINIYLSNFFKAPMVKIILPDVIWNEKLVSDKLKIYLSVMKENAVRAKASNVPILTRNAIST